MQADIDNLKNKVASGSQDEIKAAMESLQQKFYKISEKLYQQNAGANGQPGAGAAGDNGASDGQNADGTYNVNFDDDNKQS